MKRFVSYLYSTYNNQKIHNAGFARVELRTGRNRIDIHLRENGYAGKTGTVYLFIRKQKNIQGISIGNITFRGNQADFRYEQPDENIGQTPWQIDQMNGILIMIDDRGAFLSQWDEEPVDTTRFQIWNDPSEGIDQTAEDQTAKDRGAESKAGDEVADGQNTAGDNLAEHNTEKENSNRQKASNQNHKNQNVPNQNQKSQNATGQNTTGQNQRPQNTQHVPAQNAAGQNQRLQSAQNAAGQNQRPQNAQQAPAQNTAGQNQRSQNTQHAPEQNATVQNQRPQNVQQAAAQNTTVQNQKQQNTQSAAVPNVSDQNTKEPNMQRHNAKGQSAAVQNAERQNIKRQNAQAYNNKMSGHHHDSRNNHRQKNEFTVIHDSNLDHLNISADAAHTVYPAYESQGRTNVSPSSAMNQRTIMDQRRKTQYPQINGGQIGQEQNNGQIGQERNNGQIGQERNNGQIGQERNNSQTGQGQNNGQIRQERNRGQIRQEQNNGQIDQKQNDGVYTSSGKMSDLRTTELQPQQSANMQWDQTWRYMLRTYPGLNQFSEKNDVLCVRIEIKDVRLLPEKYWSMINNSFLLHGFFNYRHLAFGRIGQSWFVGIPGIYQNQEHVMASIFGFPDFLPQAEKNERGEQPGYWYRILDID